MVANKTSLTGLILLLQPSLLFGVLSPNFFSELERRTDYADSFLYGAKRKEMTIEHINPLPGASKNIIYGQALTTRGR